MKIALIAKRVSYSLGGAERIAATLSKRLAAAGHDVHIFTTHADAQIEGVHMHLLKVNTLISPWRLISFNRKVGMMLKKERFDVVYSLCQVFPIDIYRVGDGIHQLWMCIQYPNGLLRWVKYLTSLVHLAMRWLENRIFKKGNCKLFITNSRLIKDQIIELFGIPGEKILVIYNGVDQALFNEDLKKHRKALREQYSISDDELVILFVANNWERKGLATIIDAMQKAGNKSARLLIVGRGDARRYIALAKKKNIAPERLVFIGRTERVERYYGMADVFVLPTRYEPFSNVCLEAMACGLPVATTRMNGASELIRPSKNGFIIEDWSDSDALARIIKIWSDRAVREGMGAHALRTAKDYTWERHIEETSRVFEMVRDK